MSSKHTVWWQGSPNEFLFGDVATCKSELEDFGRCPIFTVEGESDTLTCHQMGFPALGIVGASSKPTDPKLHAYFAHRHVGIIYDSDKAGIDASGKLATLLLAKVTGSTVFNLTNNSMVGIPMGSDLNDTMNEVGVKPFKTNMRIAYDMISKKPY
jgi:DNA primase